MNPTRRPGLTIESVNDETLVLDSTANAAAALNASAAAIFELCDGTRTVDQITTELAAATPALDTDQVRLGLRELADAHLVDGVGSLPGRSRREMLVALGVVSAAALALPVVEILALPGVAAATSPGPGPPPAPPGPTTAPPDPPAPLPSPSFIPT